MNVAADPMSDDLLLVDQRCPDGFSTLVCSGSGATQLNKGFSERSTSEIYCPSPLSYQLYIDDELLPTTIVNGFNGWKWTPGFYAGTVRAELIPAGSLTGRTYLLDVAPDGRKLGQTEFQRLVQDILDVDPALIAGNEPATHAFGGSGPTESPDIQFAYLLQYGRSLLDALQGIERRPLRALRSSRVVVPLSRVRRVDTHTVISMVRNGSLAALKAADSGFDQAGEPRNLRFEVPFSEETLDCPATRCISALAKAVLRQAVHVWRKLERQVTAEDDTGPRSSLLSRWPRRRAFLETLTQDLDAAMSRQPFRSVRTPEITAAGLTAVAADPTYARCQRLAWKVLRPGMAVPEALNWSWMSPTWNLYETWCFVRLARAMRELMPGLAWGCIRFRKDNHGASVEGIGIDTRIRILSQRTFSHPRGEATPGEFWSISKELIPDLVVTVESPGFRRWFVLDAKYSQSRSRILDQMRSAHVYHDALRWGDAPPYRSLLLVPDSDKDLQWLRDGTFKASHGVGVLNWSPNRDVEDAMLEELSSILSA